MAKANSLITVGGTIGGLTFVKSTKYGDHVRRARGTEKKAKLNEACEEQSKRLVRSNVPAKIIHDAIKPYRKDFYYGQLWQELVSMINDVSASRNEAAFDFSALKPFELYPKYQLAHLVNLITTSAVDRDVAKLRVSLSYDKPPAFPKSYDFIDGFQVGVLVLFPDLNKLHAKTEMKYSDVIPLTEKPATLHMEFSIPPEAETFLVCVRIDGWEKHTVCGALPAKGMKMMEAGKVG